MGFWRLCAGGTGVIELSRGLCDITRLKDPKAWGLAPGRCSRPVPWLGTLHETKTHKVIDYAFARDGCSMRGIRFSFLLLKATDSHFTPKNEEHHTK